MQHVISLVVLFNSANSDQPFVLIWLEVFSLTMSKNVLDFFYSKKARVPMILLL